VREPLSSCRNGAEKWPMDPARRERERIGKRARRRNMGGASAIEGPGGYSFLPIAKRFSST